MANAIPAPTPPVPTRGSSVPDVATSAIVSAIDEMHSRMK